MRYINLRYLLTYVFFARETTATPNEKDKFNI